jgi:hypothetical protein
MLTASLAVERDAFRAPLTAALDTEWSAHDGSL